MLSLFALSPELGSAASLSYRDKSRHLQIKFKVKQWTNTADERMSFQCKSLSEFMASKGKNKNKTRKTNKLSDELKSNLEYCVLLLAAVAEN